MLGVVIVNYRNYDLAESFLKCTLPKLGVPYRAVVVDNGATPEESARLQEETGVHVIPHANEGFAVGNNVGIEWLSSFPDVDTILFSNTDIEIPEEAVMIPLLDRLSNDPGIGIIAPDVVGLDGKRQSPEPYIPLWDKYVWVYLETPFLSAERKEERFYFHYAEQAGEGFHYKLMGSFFLCRKQDLEEIGGFDPNTFLFGEEAILTERMKTIGKRPFFLPSVKVIHHHGATVSSHFSKRRVALERFRSEAYYYRRYRGYSRVSIALAGLLFRFISLFLWR